MMKAILRYCVLSIRSTHGKTSDCIAVKIKLCNFFHMIDAQIVIDTALIYAEQHLVFTREELKRIGAKA